MIFFYATVKYKGSNNILQLIVRLGQKTVSKCFFFNTPYFNKICKVNTSLNVFPLKHRFLLAVLLKNNFFNKILNSKSNDIHP